MVHTYDARFYSYTAAVSIPSAKQIVPILLASIPIRSVVDFGCGEGAWLQVWADAGVSVFGVDGAYVDKQRLRINPSYFQAADLGNPIRLERKFDLVQSLEVAEHLPAEKAEQFVDTLIEHGSVILFSAAVPGQGGENHINEQPVSYWRGLFRVRGYAAIDYIRPLIHKDATIAPWYRYNMLLYVRNDALTAIPDSVRQRRVNDQHEPDDYWPLKYRVRHAVTKRLPIGMVSSLSHLKAALRATSLPQTLGGERR